MDIRSKRPGGELSSRPLHFIWMVDCSGSMHGEKINTLNFAIRQTIPDMQNAASENPTAQVLMRVVRFSTGAQWVTASPVKAEDFHWEVLEADGITDMGRAFQLVAEQLKIPPMPERALPPVLVLLSDGQPTDDYRQPLETLLKLPWGKKAVKIAIAIGDDVEMAMLEEFTGNRELVLPANKPQDLVKLIKWASTLIKTVSSQTTPKDVKQNVVIDQNTIPSFDDDDDGGAWIN